MQNSLHSRSSSRLPLVRTLSHAGLCLLMVGGLNGCAALAVSLAGAGAGATLSHNMSGTASRTFADTLEKVDSASRLAVRKLQLEVDRVASTEKGQITHAKVSNLDVELELEQLSTTMTRVTVVARKDVFRVDAATAQEIMAQIDRALSGIQQAELAAAEAERDRLEKAKFFTQPPTVQTPSGRKGSTRPAATTTPQARKNAI